MNVCKLCQTSSVGLDTLLEILLWASARTVALQRSAFMQVKEYQLLKSNKELIRLNILSLPLELLRRILCLVPTYLRQIQVEITNRCNLKCRVYPRETYSLPDEDFPRENFFKIVNGLASPCLVTLTGWGGAFLAPSLPWNG